MGTVDIRRAQQLQHMNQPDTANSHFFPEVSCWSQERKQCTALDLRRLKMFQQDMAEPPTLRPDRMSQLHSVFLLIRLYHTNSRDRILPGKTLLRRSRSRQGTPCEQRQAGNTSPLNKLHLACPRMSQPGSRIRGSRGAVLLWLRGSSIQESRCRYQ